MKNIFILAAENSAENYGAQVIDHFKKGKKPVHFFGVGGDRFIERGVEIILHNRDLSVIGIVEVISSIYKFKRYLNHLFQYVLRKKTAAALLIDFPDFNLRLAKKLKRAGIPVYYYIGPTVWAWRYSRVKLLKKYIDHLFIIFPFERKIYEKEKIPYTYTGHPLLPLIQINENKREMRKKLGVKDNQLLITVLPGSRKSEIKFMLPVMLKALELIRKKLKIKPVLLKAHNMDRKIIETILNDSKMQMPLLDQSQGHALINSSDIVITSCGTSNLEIALIGVPFIACYRVHRLSYYLGIHFIKIRLYSIINILAQEKIVPELIQKNFKAEKICHEVLKIIHSPEEREHMLKKFDEIKKNLKQDINPSEIVYKKIIQDLSLY